MWQLFILFRENRGRISPGAKVITALKLVRTTVNHSIVDEMTIGHQVTLHSYTVKKVVLIVMGSIDLDGAEIGAGSLVPRDKNIPANLLAFDD